MFELSALGDLANAMRRIAPYIVWRKVADNQYEVLAYCKDPHECNEYLNKIEKNDSPRDNVVYGFTRNNNLNDPGTKEICRLTATVMCGYISLTD